MYIKLYVRQPITLLNQKMQFKIHQDRLVRLQTSQNRDLKKGIILDRNERADSYKSSDFNQVVQILNHYGIQYKDVNVLTDPLIRTKLSAQSGWPTIPQLYVKNEFIGGCDIIKEMYETGELKKLFDSKSINYKK